MDGKADWLGHGLPREGEKADDPRIGDLVDPDPPTCSLSDDAEAVRARLEGSRYESCLVVGSGRILLGRVAPGALARTESGVTADDLMEPGPSTVRPDKTPAEVAKRLKDADAEAAIVTTPRGRLIGAVHRSVLEQALG